MVYYDGAPFVISLSQLSITRKEMNGVMQSGNSARHLVMLSTSGPITSSITPQMINYGLQQSGAMAALSPASLPSSLLQVSPTTPLRWPRLSAVASSLPLPPLSWHPTLMTLPPPLPMITSSSPPPRLPMPSPPPPTSLPQVGQASTTNSLSGPLHAALTTL